MKTDDLISLLATGVEPIDRRQPARRFAVALLIAAVGATLLMALRFGVRPDLAAVAATPLFWAKLALPACLLLAALWLAPRLARPGVTIGGRWLAIAAPLLAVWLGAAAALLTAAPEARMALLLGQTWKTCPFNIALLSVPGFVAVFWALRGLSPVRLRLAGAVGGLLASATATLAYCLHCPEMGVPFWGVWYVLGLLLPPLAGALLGPRLLRW